MHPFVERLPKLPLVSPPHPASTESMVSMCVLVSVWLYMPGGLPSIGKTIENICVEPVPFSLVLFYKFDNFPCLIFVQWFKTETFSKNIYIFILRWIIKIFLVARAEEADNSEMEVKTSIQHFHPF